MNTTFENLPQRTFFDTNIIQNILDYNLFNEETINENVILSPNQSRKQDDLNALKLIYLSNIRGNFQFIISNRIVNELIDSKKAKLINWGFEFLDYSSSFFKINGIGKLQPNLMFLKTKDRYLILDALNMGCEVFLTMDYKTLWNKRNKIGSIKVMRPLELCTQLKPYISLFY